MPPAAPPYLSFIFFFLDRVISLYTPQQAQTHLFSLCFFFLAVLMCVRRRDGARGAVWPFNLLPSRTLTRTRILKHFHVKPAKGVRGLKCQRDVEPSPTSSKALHPAAIAAGLLIQEQSASPFPSECPASLIAKQCVVNQRSSQFHCL